MRAALAALCCAALVLAGVGCERRGQAPPSPGRPAARLVATAGFGATPLLDRRVAPGQSLLRATRGATPVTTQYGGGFVAGMLGRRSDAGARRDWFFFIGGLESPVGAADQVLRDGEVAWWDFRDWSGQASVRGVVGLWPEPFVHGYRAAPAAVSADPPLDSVLRAAGAPVVPGAAPWRVRVGADADLRARDPAWRRAGGDPGAAGIAGGITGGRVTLLGPGGAPQRPVPGARALAVLVPAGADPADGALLAVAGLDGASARAAADRIAREPGVLARAYAVAFDGAGEVVARAGR